MTKEFDVFHSLWNDYVLEETDPRFIQDLDWSRHFFFKEILKIKHTISTRAYNYGINNKSVIAYIRGVQKYLLATSAKISAYHTVFQQFSDAIDELIEFLMIDFDAYFDYHLAATIGYKIKVMSAEKENIKEIKELLITKNLNPALALLIQDYLALNNHVVETFNDLNYYAMFCREVIKWLTSEKKSDMDSLFIEGFIYINFNTDGFIEFLNTKIIKKYPDVISRDICVDQCALYIRDVKCIMEQNEWCYNPKKSSVKFAALNYLEAELGYIMNLANFKNKSGSQEIFNGPVVDYLLVNLTVEQLTYFLKLLVKHKIIIVNHQGDFFKLISARFRTKNKAGTLALNSIKNKWNRESDQTMEHIKKMFFNLIKIINLK